MSSTEFGSYALVLLLLIATAHLLGYVFSCLRQPRVIGEILAGVLLGPTILGALASYPSLGVLDFTHTVNKDNAVLGFLYHLGMALLMFVSGAETKALFNQGDRREVFWLGLVGTGLPFLITLFAAPLVPFELLIGAANHRLSFLLVLAIALAVTSIPVISKILLDLGILNTRFGRLVLSVAVIEDIILWAVLACATAIAKGSALPGYLVALKLITTLIFLGMGLIAMPSVLKWLTTATWNPLPRSSPIGYTIAILLAYCAVGVLMDISLVFAAFLAGYACVSKMRRLEDPVKTVGKAALGSFIPIYFAVVGYTLNLTQFFSPIMLLVVLTFACLIKLTSVGLGARLAGFNRNDSLNLSMAMNARGGPGIVLASVALDAQIINASFYITLVLVAVLTSLLAGVWLDYVVRTGKPLLTGEPITLHPNDQVEDTTRPVVCRL